MGTWNLGSVATEVLTVIPSVPATLSGNPTERIADRQRFFMEKFTGQSIGSVGIAEQYQPALFHLTCAQVLSSMELIGADAALVKIGEFTVQKGKFSNISEAKSNYKKSGMEELMAIGKKVNFYQAL